MGGDISDGAKIGIGLVLLVAIVAIVMQLLKMVKSQANSGSTALQDSFDKVAESDFDGYDQVEKTGTDVAAAVKIFEGRPVAIVVQTTKQAADKKAYNYGALIGSAGTETSGSDHPASAAFGKVFELQISDTAVDTFTAGTIAPWKGHSGYLAELNVIEDTGEYEYNTNYAPLDKTSTTSFVRSSGRFMSYLIKNDSGENIGVFFQQTK